MKNIINYKVLSLITCLLLPILLKAQITTSTIRGVIRTSDDKAAAAVNVGLKELNKSTITAEDGSYLLKNIKPGTYTLKVTFVGLLPQEKQVTVLPEVTLKEDFILNESASKLAEVVITAARSVNKTPVSIGKIAINPMDLPQGVSIIGSGLIADQQALRLSDVVKNVNGVYLGTTRGSSQESFYARGYSFSSTNMFKNGARVNSGAMPEISSLERVEVLKGSAAILYGNVAPGGILNLVTKQPKFEKGGEISLQTGSYDLYKPTVDVYGPINSKLAYRVNGTYENAGSFRNNVSTERYYFNPSLLYKVNSNTEVLVQADYLNHEFTPDFGTGAINNQLTSLSRSTFLGASWSNATTKQAMVSAVLNHKISSNWNLNFSNSYQHYKRDYLSTERIQPQPNGDWYRPLSRSKVGEDYFSSQVNFTGKLKTGSINHTVLTGVDAERYLNLTNAFSPMSSYDTINILDPSKYTPRNSIPTATAISSTTTPTNRVGIYVQDLFSLSKKLKVLAGIRWSFQEVKRGTTSTFSTGVNEETGTRKEDKAFSPRLGIVYQPMNSMSLFGSYANSFSLNNAIDFNTNAPMAPSMIDQFEVGVKKDWIGGNMSTNVTVYRIINHNLAQTAPYKSNSTDKNPNTSLKIFAGQTRSNGVELDITGRPLVGLTVQAGYSYNDMRFTESSGLPNSNVAGERVVNTPEHTANFTTFYTINSNKLKGLKLGATANYIGKRFGGWNNLQGQERLIPVSDFGTIDLSAGYLFKKISLLAKVSNLTNALNYYVHENYSVNPIPPRQFITTLSYKF